MSAYIIHLGLIGSKRTFLGEKDFLEPYSHLLNPRAALAWDSIAFICLSFLILLSWVFFLCCLSSSPNYEPILSLLSSEALARQRGTCHNAECVP